MAARARLAIRGPGSTVRENEVHCAEEDLDRR
jgi:hypothetical protein